MQHSELSFFFKTTMWYFESVIVVWDANREGENSSEVNGKCLLFGLFIFSDK